MDGTHRCHACGCSNEAHPEVPFCKEHFNMLPKPHRKILWGERQVGDCGGCNPRGFSKEWLSLYNLGVAILLTIEYVECDFPELVHDEDGFCWGCGVADSEKTYKTANKIVKKYGLDKKRKRDAANR